MGGDGDPADRVGEREERRNFSLEVTGEGKTGEVFLERWDGGG